MSAKNVTLGVPRLTEIINLAKNIKTPSMSVYLKDEYSRDKDEAKKAQASIEYALLSDIVSKIEIIYDPDERNQSVYPQDQNLLDSNYLVMDDEDITLGSPWVLRMELDHEIMVDKNITMALIQRKIENKYHKDLTVMTSDDNEDFPVIRIKITEDEADKGGGMEEDDEDDFSDNDFLKLLSQDMMNKLELQGIKNVKKVALREQKRTSHTRADDDGVEYDWAGTGFETRNEWMLDTEGNNLQKVLQHEHVDFSRTTCNHVLDVFEVLGIEAARNSLLSELKGVIEFDGSYVNARHISILVELMCSRGHLMAITRHGINRQETGALMRASFEETVDILLDAATCTEVDALTGVSENIILGNLIPAGTGAFGIYLAEEDLAEALDVRRAVIAMGMQQVGANGEMQPGALTPGRATPFVGGGMSPGGMMSPMVSPFMGGASPGGGMHSPFIFSPDGQVHGQGPNLDFLPCCNHFWGSFS